VHFRFLVSPVAISGSGHVESLRVERNVLEASPDGYLNARGTGEYEDPAGGYGPAQCGLLRRAAAGRALQHERKGVIPNDDGRVMNPETGNFIPGAYVVGWAKRGPTGVIGTNKKDAEETIELLLEDVKNIRRVGEPKDVLEILEGAGCTPVMFEEWQKFNATEIERGKPHGRPRVKFTTIEEARGR
jgi:ferredoxin/flavodoxin---NADP+ reductase